MLINTYTFVVYNGKSKKSEDWCSIQLSYTRIKNFRFTQIVKLLKGFVNALNCFFCLVWIFAFVCDMINIKVEREKFEHKNWKIGEIVFLCLTTLASILTFAFVKNRNWLAFSCTIVGIVSMFFFSIGFNRALVYGCGNCWCAIFAKFGVHDLVCTYWFLWFCSVDKKGQTSTATIHKAPTWQKYYWRKAGINGQ